MPRHRRRSKNKSNKVVKYALLSLAAGSVLYVLSNKAKRDCEDSVKEKIVQFMVNILGYDEKTKKSLMTKDLDGLMRYVNENIVFTPDNVKSTDDNSGLVSFHKSIDFNKIVPVLIKNCTDWMNNNSITPADLQNQILPIIKSFKNKLENKNINKNLIKNQFTKTTGNIEEEKEDELE